ncbi:hypothetical protein DQ04_03011010 [Trypanosoma grayi]|uniref:hypothetical protein n=1 Tax=Trypanosoma grayi TaxID=71804 RepID=UPI0004F455EE|nr:hypothetical protein DQ04_03011010 [Trypanosoma grayi]KEG11068.1 hypothetical protein DQ04_03011010 [Trypanosoma grayi]
MSAPAADNEATGAALARKKIVFRRNAGNSAGTTAAAPTSPATTSGSKTNSRGGAAGRGPASPPPPQQERPPLDRLVFSSIHFSAPTFVNNITNRLLFPILLSQRRNASAMGAGGGRRLSEVVGSGSGDTKNDSSGLGRGVDEKQPREGSSAGDDYAVLANRLTVTLEDAIAEIESVQETEGQALQTREVRCRRVEIREKLQLATIRLGLEATTSRLHEYENRVCNALAATAGIEQHLAQSNARVLRGRAVSQLLKHFKMLTQMNHAELNAVLKNLSKARVEQRAQVTALWEAGVVSSADPMYFGGNATPAGEVDGDNGDDGDSEVAEQQNRDDDKSHNNSVEGGTESGGPRGPFRQSGTRQLHRRSTAQNRGGGGGQAAAGGGGSRSNDVGRDKMHRLETAAVAAGLDHAFSVRSCTEAQVDWCQRLTQLCRELNGIVGNTTNVDLYVDWVRKELVADVFHLVDRFNDLYKEHPDTAVHQAYGRAILKTLELISRLYTTITPSHDALLSVFYARTINQMGTTLFSEYSPKPLPPQPSLGTTGAATVPPGSAMAHYHSTTEPDLHRTFDFLISRARRDVIVVETIFGTTNSARQQLLAKMTEGVVKPFVTQQLKLVEFFERDMVEAEGRLSPRSRRRSAGRVADAITYAHSMQVRLFSFFRAYVEELRGIFDRGEVDFLNKYADSIFNGRAAFAEQRAELELLFRYHKLLEEQHTRDLHPVPEEVFDLREAHMKKTKELIERLTEVATRTRTYALPKDIGPCILGLAKASLENMGRYLDEELRKTVESIRADRENWRMKPKSEEELLRPTKLESQQCGLRMLLFVQSSLMSLNDAIAASCMPCLQSDARLAQEIEEAREAAFEELDERAETLLNMCANAIIVRSLSILLHYQNRNDYMPKVAKGAEGEMLAQPCTRACTLFCMYVTRQFEEAKEFIRLSNGQVPQRQTASQVVSGATLDQVVSSGRFVSPSSPHQSAAPTAAAPATEASDAVRARARMMSMQQLLYGDGGPSSFVRTIGVCLYRGIVTHVKAFTVNDRGALIYKQDVTAYMEAMGPIIRTPGLGGAVVEVLFRLLKETASLLLMPWDHIKGVRDTGLLRLMSGEEKVAFIKMREDLREGFRKIAQ